jgi:hypothetical protein
MIPCQELADPEARKGFGEKAGPAAGRRTPQIARNAKSIPGGAPVGAALFHKKSAHYE